MYAAYGRCVTDLRTLDGGVFTLMADPVGVSFATKPAQPPPRVGRFRLEMDDETLTFQPAYGSSGAFIYLDDTLAPPSLAKLRAARQLRITADGKPILSSPVMEPGLSEVLDDLAACLEGRSGWWGEGARQQ